MLRSFVCVCLAFVGDARKLRATSAEYHFSAGIRDTPSGQNSNEEQQTAESNGQAVIQSPIKRLAYVLFAYNPALRLPASGQQQRYGTPIHTGRAQHHFSRVPQHGLPQHGPKYLHGHTSSRSRMEHFGLHMSGDDSLDSKSDARGTGNSENISKNGDKKNILQKMRLQWAASCEDFKRRPISYLMIPIVSAIVGYITNLVGVKMLFYPAHWRGIPFLRFPEQPFGWIGWQGVVPTKRYKMAHTMVDVTISKLLDVGEIFKRLDPRQLAQILEPEVRSRVFGGFSPPFINRFFLRRACKGVIDKAPDVVDIRSLVVSGLTEDVSTLANFFQNVGRKELDFLVNSGFGVGFVLGLFQMLQWMVFPKGWTLVAGGGLVGYITNWVALKWIFQPLNPIKFGPFFLQGMFLQRQNEVSEEFSEYIAGVVLSSKRVWADLLDGTSTPRFTKIIGSRLPLPRSQVKSLVSYLKTVVGNGKDHALHDYAQPTLRLQQTLEAKMKGMSTAEFEQVLHPIFQEDEMTLILAGAVLGTLAGGLQWWQNDKIDGWVNKLQAKFKKWRTNRSQRRTKDSLSLGSADETDNTSSAQSPDD